jgi:hypothetical protein
MGAILHDLSAPIKKSGHATVSQGQTRHDFTTKRRFRLCGRMAASGEVVRRMNPDRPSLLVNLAREVAAQTPDFQAVRGAGDGDRATHAFMRKLRDDATAAFGRDYSECKMCGDTAFAADFYFPEEATIVEVALGLPNPASEFEKDILKAFMARESGFDVRRLMFISRSGAAKKCQQPGRGAIRDWARSKHDLEIEIHELPGEPRKRLGRSLARKHHSG